MSVNDPLLSLLLDVPLLLQATEHNVSTIRKNVFIRISSITFLISSTSVAPQEFFLSLAGHEITAYTAPFLSF